MRPHAELIKKWADDMEMEIEYLHALDGWILHSNPMWHPSVKYRKKPKAKKLVSKWQWLVLNLETQMFCLTVCLFATKEEAQSIFTNKHEVISYIAESRKDVEL